MAATTTTTVYRRNNHLLSTSSSAFPSSPTTMEPFNKFNSALNQGLLNPMSPPPPSPPPTKPRSSPTLFEMMANEPELNGCVVSPHNPQIVQQNPTIPVPAQLQDSKQSILNRRLEEILAARSPGNLFDDTVSGDVKLTLSSKDGVSVCLSVHARVLVENSRFFALKLNENNLGFNGSVISVEIADCEDVEVYVETLRLMYCRDLRKKLVKEDVGKVLGVLKVSAAIGFDAGVLYCLEYLEAAPWSEEEEDKVASLLSELQLEGVGPREVLKRVSLDVTSNPHYKSENEEILFKLLQVVLEGKDEKARREMKSLVTKMLRESNSASSSSRNDLSKESLYSACDKCLASLRLYFLKASESDLSDAAQITRQADNLHWLLDILIDRQNAEDFLNTWASLKDLSEAHSKVPPIHRYEISRVTARLFVGIGKGQLLASKEARCTLLTTWLVPFYEDFGWMRRASKGLDRHVIEEGLSNTILTLPMSWQQEILLSWFDRFVNAGEDCPNIQRGFEVWWRRAFSRRNGEVERPRQVRAVNVAIEN